MDKKIREKITSFSKTFPKETFEKRHVIIRAGEDPKGIYFLEKGVVRQYIITKEGEEMTLNIFRPVSFFPMPYALDVYIPEYFFEAMEQSEIRMATKEDTLSFLAKEPEVTLDLLKRVFVGLEGILIRMEHLMSGEALSKLIAILIILARRFGEERSDGIAINLRMTHKDLASQSGLSRETVSREMSHLKDKGIIDYTSSVITIKNLQTLENLLLK